MRLMTAEKLIQLFKTIGCRIFVEDGNVCAQGGNLHNLSNAHPLWKLIKLHYPLLCKHFGVEE